MEGNLSRDQFLTRVYVSRCLRALSSRADIIKKGGLGVVGGSESEDGCGERGKSEGERREGERVGGRKKIDLKKNPGLGRQPAPGLVCKLF